MSTWYPQQPSLLVFYQLKVLTEWLLGFLKITILFLIDSMLVMENTR